MPDFPILPPISHESLSVVLLVHNDAPHLESVVHGWSTYLNRLAREYQFLLVEHDSNDESADIATNLADRSPKIQFLHIGEKHGEGEALRAGLAHAEHPLVFYARAKPWFQPSDLNRLLVEKTSQHPEEQEKKPEIDLVHVTCGYRAFRRVPGALRTVGSLWRGVARVLFSVDLEPYPGWLGWRSHLTEWLRRWCFGIHNRDAFCPMRLLRREILSRMPLQSQTSFVHVELLAKANFLQYFVTQDIPLETRAATKIAEPAETTRDIFADAWRLFTRPEFGSVQEEPGERSPC